MTRRRTGALLVVAFVAAACGADDGAAPVPSLFDDSSAMTDATTAETVAESTAPTTTAPIADRLPPLAADVAGAVRTADGLLLPILGTDGEVWTVRGACRDEAVEPAATASVVGAQHVVLDPGATWGTDDARRLLALAGAVADRLRENEVAVELTRTDDAPLAPPARAEVGAAVGARLVVTLAFGDATDESTTTDPRPVVFHQIDDPDSRRAAGLLHHHTAAALAALADDWTALAEPGVRPLLNQRGEDYFTVLRESDVAAVRLELMAAGRETALLDDEEGRVAIAAAVAEAIARFLVTAETGDGYVEPTEIVRQAPTVNTLSGCPD